MKNTNTEKVKSFIFSFLLALATFSIAATVLDYFFIHRQVFKLSFITFCDTSAFTVYIIILLLTEKQNHNVK